MAEAAPIGSMLCEFEGGWIQLLLDLYEWTRNVYMHGSGKIGLWFGGGMPTKFLNFQSPRYFTEVQLLLKADLH